MDRFPANLALLDVPNLQQIAATMAAVEGSVKKRPRVCSNLSSKNGELYCDTHDKKIEAFCDFDKQVLCISCILNEQHKKHEIQSIEQACQKEKFAFSMSLKTALVKESELHH